MASFERQNVNKLQSSLAIPGDGEISNPVFDGEMLKSLGKMESDDGSDIVGELIEIYLQLTPQRIAEIQEGLADEDWALAKHMAHTVKGGSAALGLPRFAKLCGELERAIASGTTGTAQRLGSTLNREFVLAKKALEAERRRRLAKT